MTRGLYIVLEGPEGVGKTTQLLELYKQFKKLNLAVKTFREPDTLSDLTARAIRLLTQNPNYPMNSKTEVLLYNAARSQTLKIIAQNINHGINCLVDRNYLTTLAIQYYGRADIKDYYSINSIINFAVDGIEPDICLVLDAPVQILKERTKDRNQGERFDNLDSLFLERVRSGYLWEARQRNYPVIFAIEDQATVFRKIWEHIEPKLSITTKVSQLSKPSSVSEILQNNPIKQKLEEQNPVNNLIVKKGDQYQLTTEGKNYLSKVVTDINGDVYAFYNTLSPVTIAAAMARLSRRGNDLRIILLDEFTNNLEKDKNLLQRVITAYGDDSVQQLAGLHFVIENASNLLTKKLEWGRLAAYLEQSTRYIYYDQKDSSGKYKYYLPENLKSTAKNKYIKIIDQIFDNYSEIVHQLTEYIRKTSSIPENEKDAAWKSATKAQACDAARGILPVATKSTVGIFASGQALESLIYHLLADDLQESRNIGQKLLQQAKKVIPVFLERAEKPDRGGAFVAYQNQTHQKIKKISQELFKNNYPKEASSDPRLVDYYPKNELDLLPDMLFSSSDLSLSEIETIINQLSYDQKLKIFKIYIGERLNRRHKPGRALEKAHYSWEIVCDYGIFRDLQRHRMVDSLEWQNLTPRFGYEVPELIEKASLSEKYQECFDLSLELYSYLQKQNYFNEAQYAILLGHKMRWKISYNGREAIHLHELRTSPQGHPGYRKLVNLMHQKIVDVHPNIGKAMKFVNQDEDPELTRLAAERYQQFKLEQLKQK
ncbi:MAG: dTMP kinase [Patescibacteria group bacterium]|nr:dTMP kinase [Patescibacteria group bacterium]